MSQATQEPLQTFRDYLEYAKWVSVLVGQPEESLEELLLDPNPMKRCAARTLLVDQIDNWRQFDNCRRIFVTRLIILGEEKEQQFQPIVEWMHSVVAHHAPELLESGQ